MNNVYVPLTYGLLGGGGTLTNGQGPVGTSRAFSQVMDCVEGACNGWPIVVSPPHIIKIMGDWKSDAYLRYLTLTLQDRYDAMTQFISCT